MRVTPPPCTDSVNFVHLELEIALSPFLFLVHPPFATPTLPPPINVEENNEDNQRKGKKKTSGS